ncbi:MAG: hypothetical protein WAN05_22610 [Roseiarcus sp.]
MLEELIRDQVSSLKASNQPMFRTDVDYEAEEKKRRAVVSDWATLDAVERAKFKDQASFEASKGVLDLKDPAILPARLTLCSLGKPLSAWQLQMISSFYQLTGWILTILLWNWLRASKTWKI